MCPQGQFFSCSCTDSRVGNPGSLSCPTGALALGTHSRPNPSSYQKSLVASLLLPNCTVSQGRFLFRKNQRNSFQRETRRRRRRPRVPPGSAHRLRSRQHSLSPERTAIQGPRTSLCIEVTGSHCTSHSRERCRSVTKRQSGREQGPRAPVHARRRTYWVSFQPSGRKSQRGPHGLNKMLRAKHLHRYTHISSCL